MHHIKDAARIFNNFRKYMIPPSYDMILENPIELLVNLLDSDIKFSGNVLNFYKNEKVEEISLKASAKVNDINSVLPSEYKDASEYLDLMLLVKSVKSIFRKCYIFEKKGNIFKTELNLKRQDWRNEIEISALLILKRDIKENNGYASEKGTQLGWSSSYKIYFDKPEEKSGGASMDLQWESFSGPKLFWLNDHYSKDIYTLDIARGNKMPKIYLNSDIDPHLKSLIVEKSTRSSIKTSSRNLMFQTISKRNSFPTITVNLHVHVFPQLGLPIRGSYYTPKQWVDRPGVGRTRVPRGW